MSEPTFTWSTSASSTTSITSSTPLASPPPPFQHPAARTKRRSTIANKENVSSLPSHPTARFSLTPSKPSDHHLSSALPPLPLTPSSASTNSPRHSLPPSSPLKPFPPLLLSPTSSHSHPTLTPIPTPIPSSSDENIRVIVRIRALPPSTSTCVSLPSPSTVTIRRDADHREYSACFDHVYDPSTPTATVFNDTSASLIHSLVRGYNGSILAYGQTSSGKTYTMMGDVTDGSPTQRLHGIIPRCMDLLFSAITAEVDRFHLAARQAATEAGSVDPPQSVSYAVALSYFEIYNERVYDLGAPLTQRHPLDVRENSEQGVHIPDLTRRIISTPAQALEYIQAGNETRRVAATAHNVVSSRSHAVIQVTVERKVVGGAGGVVVSRLDLVDLAGSERYDSRTHGLECKDGRSKAAEMSSINKSLNNLALVVTALTSQSKHVPYRNSTLTHLLKDSLGGHAKCQLIACINPAVDGAYESMNTLKYASRAKMIKNEVRQAAVRGEGEEGAMRGLHAEIERLRREKVAEKRKRRLFISEMTGVVTRMAQVCEEEDQADVPVEEEEDVDDPAEDDAFPSLSPPKEEPEGEAGEQKLLPRASSLHVSSRRSSSERLSVRFQDELDATSDPITSDALNCSLLSTSSILNASTRSYSGRRYQFCDLFTTPLQPKAKKRRYRFSVCDTLHSQGTPAAAAADVPETPVESGLFSPATEKLLQDFDAGMGKIYAVVKRKGRRDELRRESAMEVVREVEEMERVIQQVREEGEQRERDRDALLASHSDAMRAKEAEVREVRDRLALLRREGQGKEEEVAAMRAQVIAKTEEMAVMCAEHERAIEEREATIEVRDAAIAELHRRVQEAEAAREELIARIAGLELQLSEKEEEAQVLQLRVDLLQSEARQKELEAVALIANYDQQRKEADALIAQQRRLMAEVQSRVEALTAETAQLRVDVRRAEVATAGKEVEAEQKLKEVRALRLTVERYQAQVASMAAAATAGAQRYAEEIAAVRRRGESLADELKDDNELVLAAMVVEAEQAKAKWDLQLQQQAAVIAQLTQRVDTLSQQLQAEQERGLQVDLDLTDSRAALIAKQEELVCVQSELCEAAGQREEDMRRWEEERHRLTDEAGRLHAEYSASEGRLQQVIATYEEKKRETDELTMHLAMEVTELQQRLASLTAECAAMQSKLEAAEWRVGVKGEEVTDLTTSLRSRSTQLAAVQQQLQQTQQQWTALKDESAAQYQRHEDDVKQQLIALHNLRQQHDQGTAAQLQAHTEEMAQLTVTHDARVQALQGEVTLKEAERAAMQTTIERLQATIAEREADLAAAAALRQSGVAESQAMQLQQQKAIASLKVRVQTIAAELVEARTQSQMSQVATSSQAQQKEQELRLLQADLLLHQHAAAELQTQLAALQSEQRLSTADRVDEAATVASLVAQLDEKTSTLASLQLQLAAHEKETQHLQHSLAALTETHSSSLAHLNSEVTRLTDVASTLAAQSDAHAADAARKADLLSSLEAEKMGVDATLKRLRGLYERNLKVGGAAEKESRRAVAESQRRVEEVEGRLEEMARVVEEFERGMRGKEDEVEAKQRMVELLQSTIDEGERSRAALAQEIGRLHEEAKMRGEERGQLQSTIEQVQTALALRDADVVALRAEHRVQMTAQEGLQWQQEDAIAALCARIQTLEAEVAAAKEEVGEEKVIATAELQAKQEELQQLQAELERHQVLVTELQLRMQQREDSHARIIQQADDAAAVARSTIESLAAQLQAKKADSCHQAALLQTLTTDKAHVQSTLDRLRSLYERQLRADVQRTKQATPSAVASAQAVQQLIAKEQRVLELERQVEQMQAEMERAAAEREEERKLAAAKEAGLVSVLQEKAESREEELSVMDGLMDCVVGEREREKAARVRVEAELSQVQSMLYQSIARAKQVQAAMRSVESRVDEVKGEVEYWKAQAEERQRKKAELMLRYQQAQTQHDEALQRLEERQEQRRKDSERLTRAFEHNLALRDGRLCEMNQEVSDLQAQAAILRLQLSRATDAVERDSNTIDRLRASETAATQRVGLLEEILSVQNGVMEDKDEALRALQLRLSAAEDSRTALTRQTASVSGSLSWAAEQVTALASSFSALEQKLQVKEAEIGEREEEILILSSQLTLLKQESSTLAAALQREQAEHMRLTSLVTELQHEALIARSQRDMEAAQQAALQVQSDGERETLRRELDGLACQISAYTEERRLSQEARRVRGDRKRMADLVATIEELERALKAKSDQLDGLRADGEQRHEEELLPLQLALLEKTTTIDGQAREIQQLQDNVAFLSQSLTNLNHLHRDTAPLSPPRSRSPSPSPSASPYCQDPFPSPTPSPSHTPRPSISMQSRQSMSFARVISELRTKQVALAAAEALQAAMAEKEAELASVKENKRSTVMRMSLEIDRLRAELHPHPPSPLPSPPSPPPSFPTSPLPPPPPPPPAPINDEDAVALERLLNTTRIPFHPAHPFPSLALVHSRAHPLFPPHPAPHASGPARLTPQALKGLSPLRPIELRLKRKRLSVDFEGMDSEEEISQGRGGAGGQSEGGEGAVEEKPVVAHSKCSIM